METTTPIRHKAFTYHTACEWLGGKAATFSSTGKPSFRVSSPPEFRGEENVWTPEDLFVGAIETCLLMTFSSIIQKRQLAVEAYESEATGLLEFVDTGYRFTRVELKPKIIVANQESIEPVLEAIRRAHRDCLVANSLLTEVIVEPDVRLRDVV
jgi:organic hydroperoxide reductase OsmC/OhrA